MVLATGDLKNSVTRLRALLRATRYPHAQAHANGAFAVADLLRILHFALLDYSRHVAAFILDKGYDLYGKTDVRFIDKCFRLLRDEFQYFPSVNSTQFLSNQFQERKIQLVADILDIVIKKHEDCVRRRRQEQAVWSKPRELKTRATHVENHVLPAQAPTVESPSIDTWSVLEHLRQEAKENAREQKRVAAQRLQQKRQRNQTHVADGDYEQETVAPAPSPRRSPSPTMNQRASVSESTDSNSDTEAERLSHQRPSTASNHQTHIACACGCGDTKSEVQEVIVTLSQQISDLTTAVLSRVSAIESRLARVEEQLQDFQKPPPTTPNASSTSSGPLRSQRYVPISRTKAAFAASASSTEDATEPRSRTAWPPDPSLFNLP